MLCFARPDPARGRESRKVEVLRGGIALRYTRWLVEVFLGTSALECGFPRRRSLINSLI